MVINFTLTELNALLTGTGSTGAERLAFLNIILDGITGTNGLTAQDLADLITASTGAEQTAFKNVIVNGLNAQDLADMITASNRAQKEALAELVIQAEDFLNQTNAATRQAASDARRTAALAFIAANVTPLLTDPTTGDYATQHSQLNANIAIIDGEIATAVDEETKEELIKVRQTERDKRKTLKQQHAQGLIT